MPRRPQLAGRLARVEAAFKVPLWPFALTSGRTASVPVKTVLAVLMEAMAVVHDPDGEHPPLSKHLLLLAQADEDAESSVMGGAALQLARRAREVKGQ
ncbi:hypothetical protein [Streptomyces sp. enrichment culture]|uniref:hypothetical protein n=1 Tax=Streptomyces sp. enrichment culture TaxID=1795815 RepID=UPI003F57FFDD